MRRRFPAAYLKSFSTTAPDPAQQTAGRRLKNPPKKTGGEDPLIAKLKAMGETRGPSSDETKKGKL